jgi:uncharacterized protein
MPFVVTQIPPGAQAIINALDLQPHPREGGYFIETHRNTESVTIHGSERSLATAIYFLVLGGYPTELHRLPGAEIFHYYLGAPLELFLYDEAAGSRVMLLGPDIMAGNRPQVIIPGGVWQAARVKRRGDFSLVGTTMAPGFDYHDYQTDDPDSWAKKHPAGRDGMKEFLFSSETPR